MQDAYTIRVGVKSNFIKAFTKHSHITKTVQIRGIRRRIFKHEIKNKKASKQKQTLASNDEVIPSKDVTRKIKSEQMQK